MTARVAELRGVLLMVYQQHWNCAFIAANLIMILLMKTGYNVLSVDSGVMSLVLQWNQTKILSATTVSDN